MGMYVTVNWRATLKIHITTCLGVLCTPHCTLQAKIMLPSETEAMLSLPEFQKSLASSQPAVNKLCVTQA